MSHQAEACIGEAQAAIRINPADALAHEDLGDALIERGRRAEARAQWQQVLQLDNRSTAQEARQMLAKYPWSNTGVPGTETETVTSRGLTHR